MQARDGSGSNEIGRDGRAGLMKRMRKGTEDNEVGHQAQLVRDGAHASCSRLVDFYLQLLFSAVYWSPLGLLPHHCCAWTPFPRYVCISTTNIYKIEKFLMPLCGAFY